MSDLASLKASMDVLNSIAVSKDIIQVRADRPWVARLVTQWTGHQRREQELLSLQFTVGLEGLSAILTQVRENANESDLILGKTIDKVNAIGGLLSQRTRDIAEIQSHLTKLEFGLSDLERRVEFGEAHNAVERFIADLQEKLSADHVDLGWLLNAIDEMWWGVFGVVCRRSPEEAQTLLDYLANRLRHTLRGRYGLAGGIPVSEIVQRIPIAVPGERETAELLAFYPTWQMRPVSKAVLTHRLGELETEREAKMLPVMTTPERLTERVIDEVRRGVPE